MNTDIYSTLKLPFSPLNFTDEELTIAYLKQSLDQFYQWSVAEFKANADIEKLIYTRAKFIDELLIRLWKNFHIPDQVASIFKSNRISLIAVGGYGRSELHPLSDIDILICQHKLTLSLKSLFKRLNTLFAVENQPLRFLLMLALETTLLIYRTNKIICMKVHTY